MEMAITYSDVCQMISRVMSCSIQNVIVPSCLGDDQGTELQNITEQKAKGSISFKVSDSHHAARKPPKSDDQILKIFPFAKDQPLWVYRAMYDYININKTFDIIKFFNEGGALAYKEGLTQKDLAHHSSHDEKVNSLEI